MAALFSVFVVGVVAVGSRRWCWRWETERRGLAVPLSPLIESVASDRFIQKAPPPSGFCRV